IRELSPMHSTPATKHRRVERLAWVILALVAAAADLTARLSAAPEPTSRGGVDAILRWQSLGPDRGGRVTTVAGVPQRPFRFYAGAVGGGILRTNNAGATWDRIDTKVFGSASVGAI